MKKEYVLPAALAVVVAACHVRDDRTAGGNTASSTVTVASGSPTSVAASSTAASTTPELVVDSSALVTAPWTDTKQVMDTTLDAPNFQCAPKVVTRNDTITLRAEVPHGGWLAVQDPSDVFYYFTTPLSRETGYSVVVDPEAFKNMLVLRFRADIKLRPYVHGHDTTETVFRKPGKYTFTIGENLATEYDEEDPNWHCTVEVRGSP
jgi:hypothetical protein